LGAIRAAVLVYPNLHVVHIDAHTDLRDEFYDNPLSHACVIRRAHELIGDHRIHSFGVRAGLREEFSLREIILISSVFAKRGVYIAG